MSRFRLIAGRVRSTGWEPLVTGGFWPPAWCENRFRCRFDFAHLVSGREPVPDFRLFSRSDSDYPTGP